MGASTILFPLAKTIHWLGTASSCALLKRVHVWASIFIVRNTCGDLVGSAPLVLVISSIMEASAIHVPVSNAVHRLRATLSNTLHLAFLVWALLSTQIRLCGDLVSSAPLVLVTVRHVLASAVDIPLALTIHRLAATALRAVLLLVLVWASIAIVSGSSANLVEAAALVLVTISNVVAGIICTPRANAVHWLRATIVGALLKRIRVGTGKTIVGRCNRDLIQSASLVLVGILVMNTGCILIPRANAVNRLRASDLCALHIAISIGTSISVVGRWTLNHVSSALLVLVIRSIMGTSAILFPVAKTINRLGATLSGALLVAISVSTSITIVRHTGGDLVGSALLVDVVLCVILTVGVLCPVSDTIHRLAASRFCAFLFLMLVRASLSVQISFNSHNIVSAFRIVVAVLDV